MKRLFLLLMGSVLSAFTIKDDSPIHWTFTARQLRPGEYELHFTATLSPGWHVYSQFQPKEAVSDPTKITITRNPLVAVQNPAKEYGVKVKYEDQTAGIVQYQYANQVDFVQVVTTRNKGSINTNLTGTVHFQVCTDKQCLQPEDTPFEISLPADNAVGM